MKQKHANVLLLVFILAFKTLISPGQQGNEKPVMLNSMIKISDMAKYQLDHSRIKPDFVGKPYAFKSTGVDDGTGVTYSISASGVHIGPSSNANIVSTLTINLTYSPDATFLSAGLTAADIVNMKAANVYAAQQFTNNYSDPIDVNITVTAVPGTGTLGGSNTSIFSTGFAAMVAATVADATTADDATTTAAGGSIPSTLTDPIGGTHNWWVSKAQRKALGLAADDLTNDGTYTFGGGFSYTYDPLNRAVAGRFDYIGVTMHEFSEIMGRIPGLGGTISGSPAYLQFDLFHYTGAATRGLTSGNGRSFSINNGSTMLKAFNFPNGNGSDPQDWASGTNDCFNAFSNSGVQNALSAVDLRNMDVIGYDFTPCTPPTISCPSNITVNNNPGQCGANVSYPAATATGSPAPTITYSVASGSLFPVGTTTVTATATSSCGTATCTFTVTVNDNQFPVITCPFNITVNNDPGICGAVVNYTQPSATDNCGTGTLPISIPGYTYKGTFGGHTYFVSNNTALPETAHAAAIALGGHLVTIASAAENAFVSAMRPETMWIGFTDRAVEGTYKWITNEPVTYTNWAPGEPNDCCSATPHEEDWAVINWTPGGTWNDWFYNISNYYVVEFEGGTIPTTLVSGPASGSIFPVGTTTVTYQATDASNNTSTCSFTVTVNDNEAPVLNVSSIGCSSLDQAAVNECLNAAENFDPATWAPAVAALYHDNCGTVTAAWQSTSAGAGNTDCSWSFTYTYQISDNHNNSVTCSVSRSGGDKAPPTFTAPPDVIIPFITTCSYDASVTNTGDVTNEQDNCSTGLQATYTDQNAWCGNNLVITRTWHLVDNCGNAAADQVQKITVTDNNTPYIIYASKEAGFGEDYDINGDVGVTSSNGKAEFKKNSVLDPNWVKAHEIKVQLPSGVNNKVYSPATGGPNPPYFYYSGGGLSGNYTQTANGIVPVGDFKQLTIRKAVIATVNGSNYGKVKIEEGADVTFTSGTINIESLEVMNGKKNGPTTNVHFTGCTALKIKEKVSIGEYCLINVGGPKVICYVGDGDKDDDKFDVKGKNTQVTMNIMIPKGKLEVHGNDDAGCIMTGWFIVEELDGDGRNVTWNPYGCAAPPFAFGGETPVTEKIAVPQPVVKERLFSVNVAPNPSASRFTIIVSGSSDAPVTIRIMDMSGVVKSAQVLSGKSNTLVVGDDWLSGTYMAEVTQGSNRKVLKLLKIN